MLDHATSEPEVPRRVVVIGSGGFIGKALLDLLLKKKILAIGLRSSDIDLRDPEAHLALAEKLEPGDSIVMLAALTPDKGSGSGTFQENIAMAASVCNALDSTDPAHIVYFSSDSVYPMVDGIVNEMSPAEATDLYGAMHLSRELMFKAIAKCPVAILRPTLVYGAQDTHNSYGPNRLRRMAQKDGDITLFGDGEETRDHIYIDDVVRLTLDVILRKSKGALGVVTGKSLSYMELAKKVAAEFDNEISITCTPRQNPITHRHFDNTALRKAFPEFRFTSLRDGLSAAHQEMLGNSLD